jgi:hypothetical protein
MSTCLFTMSAYDLTRYIRKFVFNYEHFSSISDATSARDGMFIKVQRAADAKAWPVEDMSVRVKSCAYAVI